MVCATVTPRAALRTKENCCRPRCEPSKSNFWLAVGTNAVHRKEVDFKTGSKFIHWLGQDLSISDLPKLWCVLLSCFGQARCARADESTNCAGDDPNAHFQEATKPETDEDVMRSSFRHFIAAPPNRQARLSMRDRPVCRCPGKVAPTYLHNGEHRAKMGFSDSQESPEHPSCDAAQSAISRVPGLCTLPGAAPNPFLHVARGSMGMQPPASL
ncbi:hypothetical protein N658DRAFT_357159 [Parathielavia hyrcaniae]|uniref:Uncharacterized protein n=1 Tax=Parathielavia hyrcaniae TaxID=113614 RepID=A0AAN6Q278_9PEZI|nr:hypothetical protein N658DRAFT_357159 [Parathielavia hyrcaniae]